MRPDAPDSARWGRRPLVLALVPLALLAGGGCTLPLSFQNRVDAGSNSGQGGSNGDAGSDTPVLGVGGNGSGGNGSGGNGSGGNGSGGAPIDAPVDNRDAPIDMPRIDVPIDTPRDLPRDNGVDAGPIVCTVPANCRLAGLTLTCLIATGQPGRCVECIGNADCAGNANAKFCDLNTHRCVECLVGSTDCPTSDESHASVCSQNHRCLNGCDDSGPACPAKPGNVQPVCAGGGVNLCLYCTVSSQCGAGGTCLSDNVCVYCLNDTSCAGTTAPHCDLIAGRCVQCRDSLDCTTAGFPLCNPSTLTCVAVP